MGRTRSPVRKASEVRLRSDLAPLQEAEHFARRKELWQADAERRLAQNDEDAVDGTTCSGNDRRADGRKKGPQHLDGFATETANATGKTKQTVNRAIRRATQICQEARDMISGTALDTGKYLDSIASRDMTDEEQVEYVQEADAERKFAQKDEETGGTTCPTQLDTRGQRK